MRIVLVSLILLTTGANAWAVKPSTPLDHPPQSTIRQPAEQLVPTPPVIVRFGWSTSELERLVAGLRSSTEVYTLYAGAAGILEYTCRPNQIVPWGGCLFRIYELGLLEDLTQAETVAARIGSLPFVIAPRDFPAPTQRATTLTLSPPPIHRESDESKPSLPPAQPIVRRLTKAERETPSEAPAPLPSGSATEPPVPKRVALEEASQRLAAAEERLDRMRTLLRAVRADLESAEQQVVVLREDVEARRRLADSGVIARNDVKAAEERLHEAERVAATARAAVQEGEAALARAEADRTMALVGVEKAAAAPKPIAAAAEMSPQPTVPLSQKPRADELPLSPRTSVPSSAPGETFPVPLRSGEGSSSRLPPAPTETLTLARPSDVPIDPDWGPLPLPARGVQLAQERWDEHGAPWQCIVTRLLMPQGSRVDAKTPVMEVRQTAIARLRAEVAEPYVGLCRVGAPVEVFFPTYDATYIGWVSRVEPTHTPRPPGAEIEILLAERRPGDTLVYPALEWMALSTGLVQRPEPLSYEAPAAIRPAPLDMQALFPLPETGRSSSTVAPDDGQLSGAMELITSSRSAGLAAGDPAAQRRIERLRAWRESFVAGMQTTVFPETGLTLTYPRDGEIARAVERMATRRVSHLPNMCAHTLAEALGWGLGDAAMWARRLPERGYKLREDGIARPGDILVWPFTYGPRRSQHVGIAVAQGGTIMLLSNESGTLGTTPLKEGYLAFYKPRPLGTSPSRGAISFSATQTGSTIRPLIRPVESARTQDPRGLAHRRWEQYHARWLQLWQ
ncbi:MAG: hypothetical protein ACUVX8_07995 [Candidatus Zipacnadales bacterium]